MNVGMAEIENLLRDYQDWLGDKTTLRNVNGEVTPSTTSPIV